jgi:hypothetical protein
MMTPASTQWRPIAHVTIEDATCRSAVIETLQQHGWAVVEQPTGLHLTHAISGVILGDQPWLRPGLIVADAVARGCSGVTIGQGLRELGLNIPVVLIANRRAEPPASNDSAITVVSPGNAASTVAQLIRLPTALPRAPDPLRTTA